MSIASTKCGIAPALGTEQSRGLFSRQRSMGKVAMSAYKSLPKLRGHVAVFILATALAAYFAVAAIGIVFGVRTIVRLLLS